MRSWKTLASSAVPVTLRPRLVLAIVCSVVLLWWGLPNMAQADDGDLDPGFGEGGKVTTGFGVPGNAGASAKAIAVQPDGKLVLAGNGPHPSGGPSDFALARYNGDGTLDSSFGESGKVSTGVLRAYDEALAVAVQPDGKIVAAGGSGDFSTSDAFSLVRYNDDGSLDPTFGNGGKVTTAFDGSISEAHGIVIQSDGKIVVGGYVETLSGVQFAVARYKTNGGLDKSFGSGGRVTTSFPSGSASAQAMAIQSDGKILLAGYSFRETKGADFAVARYNSDGSLDSSFGAGGKTTTDLGAQYNLAFAITLEPDGRIVLAGLSGDDKTVDLALVRYNSDGNLDTSFGSNGRVRTDLGGYEAIYAVSVQRDGRIVAAGIAGSGEQADFAVVRYDVSGMLDPTFGSGGTITTDFGGFDVAFGIAILPGGRIVVAGVGGVSEGYFALACYQTEAFIPNITSADINGKKLYVHGKNFDYGAELLINDEKQPKTFNDEFTPATMLIARKSGKKIAPGETVTLQVRNSDGGLSNQFSFTRPVQ